MTRKLTRFEFIYDVLNAYQDGLTTTIMCCAIIDDAYKQEENFDYSEMLAAFHKRFNKEQFS